MSTITVSVQVETDLDSADTLDELWAVINEVKDKAFDLVSVRIPGSVAIVDDFVEESEWERGEA